MTALAAIALAALAIGAAPTAPDAPTVTGYVSVEPPVIPFHKQARYTVVVEAPADLDVKAADMVEKFGGLSVYGVPERNVTALKDGRRRFEETYVLDPIFAGNYAIAPFEVTWGEGEKLVVPSPGLRVRDLTDEEKKAVETFAPNADPLSPEPPVGPWWVWTIVGALVVAAAGGAVYLLYRRKGAKAEPALSPWDVAYRRLRQLDERHLPEEGKFDLYYVDLSSILRYYIEDRFHLHAPEQTTPEFLGTAASSGLLSDDHQKLVGHFLRHCDLVKFARHVPALEEMEQSFSEVLRFVDQTVPALEPAQQEAA